MANKRAPDGANLAKMILGYQTSADASRKREGKRRFVESKVKVPGEGSVCVLSAGFRRLFEKELLAHRELRRAARRLARAYEALAEEHEVLKSQCEVLEVEVNSKEESRSDAEVSDEESDDGLPLPHCQAV